MKLGTVHGRTRCTQASHSAAPPVARFAADIREGAAPRAMKVFLGANAHVNGSRYAHARAHAASCIRSRDFVAAESGTACTRVAERGVGREMKTGHIGVQNIYRIGIKLTLRHEAPLNSDARAG